MEFFDENGRSSPGWIVATLICAACAIIAVLAAIFFAAVVLLTRPADAHDAPPTKVQPTGWQYGFECCSLSDCRPVTGPDVRESAQGYVIASTGELIPYGDKKIKQSRDELFHWCSHGGKSDGGTICLYVPDRGY